MDGVILFVDDKVHQCQAKDNDLERTPENQLFETLRRDYPVLGVKDLDLAERAIKSIGSFSAIILDWVFDDKDELFNSDENSEDLRYVKGGAIKEDRTLNFLENNDFYSLVYIYSNEDVEGKYGTRLRERFGDRIQFERKTSSELLAEGIINKIKDWAIRNQNLSIPLAWAATINQSIQEIFKELADADVNWLRDIAQSAREDGLCEDLFIIDVFQYLLVEKIAQNANLRNSIQGYLASHTDETAEVRSEPTNEESIAKLFKRLFYTRINDDVPIMTGDICQINENRYGIIITPECDIRKILGNEEYKFEMLVFERNAFNLHIAKTRALKANGKLQNFKRERYSEWENGTDSQKEKLAELRKIFNQNEPRFHILPSFPISSSLNESMVIEFSLGLEMHGCREVKSYKREYKLNSPFIQQLRQRYISYLGRVGVPSLPTSLRNFNLK